MPEGVNKLVFNDPDISKLAKNDIDLTVHTKHSVDLISNFTFFILSKNAKPPVEVDIYIAKYDGSVLLSSETVFHLQLLDVKQRFEYLPPSGNLISSVSKLSQERDTYTIQIHKTTTQHRSCPFWICISQFWIYNCTIWIHK